MKRAFINSFVLDSVIKRETLAIPDILLLVSLLKSYICLSKIDFFCLFLHLISFHYVKTISKAWNFSKEIKL